MPKFNAKVFFIKIFVGLVFISCTGNQNIQILTDNPNVVNLVNIYNKDTNSDISVRFVNSVNNISQSINTDVIISQNINNSQFISEFSNIKLKNDFYYYKELLDICRYQDRLKLMPISYNLSVVKYLNNTYDTPNMSIDDIKYLGYQTTDLFYMKKEGKLINYLLKINGFHFFNNDKIEFDDENLIKNINEIVKKYDFKDVKVDSEYNLLEDGYVLGKFEDTESFYNNKENYKYDFSFLTDSNNNIIVDNDILYFAILRKSPNQEACLEFLKWILNTKNQKKYIDYSKKMSISPYGFLDGYSILKDINILLFSKYYKIQDKGLVIIEKNINPIPKRITKEIIEPALEKIIFLNESEKILAIKQMRLDIENKFTLLKKEDEKHL